MSNVADTIGSSSRTVHRILQLSPPTTTGVPDISPVANRRIMIIVDCTYFKRICVYLVVRDWYTKKNIYYKRVPYETIHAYVEAIDYLEKQGYVIDGIVIDGRRGLFKIFSPSYPIQMCQFHQKQIVRKYLTNHPQTEAGQELKKIVEQLASCDREWFEILLDVWYTKYGSFIKERTVNPINPKRWHYTHKRLRSAYRSLRTNLPYLFTYKTTKGMPNTTNSLDGFFSHLKDGVRIHRGLKLGRKMKLIEYLIVR